MKTFWLLIKNLLFAIVVPGFVVGWAPLNWFEKRARWPEQWSVLQFAGAAFFALGMIVFTHCLWLFCMRGRGTPAPFDPPKHLVRRGLYKWVRNPMYLAIFALVAGEALFLRSGHIGVYFVCLVCVVHVFVVLHEENALRYRFGAIYEDYRREVPRWVPRRPRPQLQTVPPFTKNR